MRSLRGRFILSHLLPILLVVPLVGVALVYLLETQVLLTQLSQDVTDRANLLAATINDHPEIWSSPAEAQAFLANTQVYVDEQILLLRPNGEFLAASRTWRDGQVITEELTLNIQRQELADESDAPAVELRYGLREQRAVAFVPVTGRNNEQLGIIGVSDTLAGAASQFTRLRWWIVGILLLELLLGGFLGLVLALRLERPIERAATAVVDIAHGKAVEPVPEEGPTEVRALSQAVNTLAERLRVLEETRRRSLANIVHELGRPLGAVGAAVHVLRNADIQDEAVEDELLEGITQSLARMQPLLDDLSQLYGQVQGTITLDLEPTALNAWLPPVLSPWRAAAQEKGVQWETAISPDLPTLAIDPGRLARAVGNLLSNAVKYTPPGGTVRVTAAATARDVTIGVSDTGPGIAVEEQQRVFEPFFRSQRDRRFPQGLGLGLTIARDIVEAHDGRLTLESEPGEGSRFTIHLPVGPSLLPSASGARQSTLRTPATPPARQ